MRHTLLPAMLLITLAAWAAEAGAKGASATLVNHSTYDIHELYLSPSDDPHWGPDQLGKYVLGSGESFTLHSIPCDDYDVKMVDEDGDECVVSEQYLCGDAGDWILTDEELLECAGFKTASASATLTNGSRWDIYELYLSPSHESHWGPDQLGKEVLESGDSYTVTGLPCGDYDLKLVDEDGEVCVLEEIYLCGAEGEAVLTDRELLDCLGY